MRQQRQSAPETAQVGAASARRTFSITRPASLPYRINGWKPLSLATVAAVVSAIFLALFAVLVQAESLESRAHDTVFLVAPAMSLACVALAMRRSQGRERRGWLLIGLGVSAWAAGDLIYAFYSLVLNRAVPFPSVADAGYLPGYLFLVPGFLYLFPIRWELPDSRVIVDACAVLLAVFALSWPYLVAPSFNDNLDMFATLVSVAYPVLDLVALGVLVVAFYGSREQSPSRFLALITALSISVIGDSFFASNVTLEGEYAKVLDILYAAAYCLFAIAALTPVQTRGETASLTALPGRSAISLHLPRVLTLPLVVLATFETPLTGAPAMVIDGAALTMIGLLAIRHALMGRENSQLLARLQGDSNERAALLQALGDLGEGFAIIEDGRVLAANHALWHIIGYSEAEVRDMPSVGAVVAERDRARLSAIMQRAVESDSIVSGVEIAILTKDGTEVAVELASMPLKKGDKTQILIVARDISERKQSQRIVLESQKLEGLRVLAGGVAHDFNNLLQVIRGSVALALLEAGEKSVAAPYLNEIDRASDRAAGLARQMLIYAGKADPIVSTVEPAGVVEDMALLLRSSLGERIELTVTAARNTHRVLVDASQLRQVVMNLVVNASESIGGSGGTIRVHTANQYLRQQDLTVAHAGNELHAGLYVVISVTDTGAGMSEEVRRRIFDPFYTTKFTGRGLGLAAVLGIVRAHGGGIAVESVLGQGATFRVMLPADAAVASVAS